MRDNELAVVEHNVADELVEEVAGLLAELVRLASELFERFTDPVSDLDIAALELAGGYTL